MLGTNARYVSDAKNLKEENPAVFEHKTSEHTGNQVGE
jgi:hypothetical protein